jgi:hypothetical protein
MRVLFFDPALAALIGWCVSMTTRQLATSSSNRAASTRSTSVTDAYKEEVKVGYNMRRKTVLLAVWALIPLVLWLQPSLFGLIEPADRLRLAARRGHRLAGAGRAGLVLPRAAAGAGRAVHRPGLADQDPDRPVSRHPLYWKSPLALLRGELHRPDDARAQHVPGRARGRSETPPGGAVISDSAERPCAAAAEIGCCGWSLRPSSPPPAVSPASRVAAATKRRSTASKSASL